jgi:UDP-N-acetylglucosamine--N-acetylmuramyl-(pentapeptide) pyrophosphoryl-undecaprenol N-acetylglucosamine transferase
VLPGLVVAQALQDAGRSRDLLHYIGATRGMEARLVPPTGIGSTLLPMRSFPRTLTPWHLVALLQLAAAFLRVMASFVRHRPGVVVSVGGYASVPAVVAAALLRVPIVAISYDVLPGRASVLAARFAKATAVAFEASPLPRKVVTGFALRAEILAVEPARDRPAARAALGLPLDRLVVLVFGGSHGSGALNEIVAAFVAANGARADLAIRHVVGMRNAATMAPERDGMDGIVYQAVAYEDDMARAYAAADVVLARSGASTIAELAAIGVPSILVPWPDAAEDHQTDNARFLSDVGGAVLVPEAELGIDRLSSELDHLADPRARQAMAAAARSRALRDGAVRIAALVEECASR